MLARQALWIGDISSSHMGPNHVQAADAAAGDSSNRDHMRFFQPQISTPPPEKPSLFNRLNFRSPPKELLKKVDEGDSIRRPSKVRSDLARIGAYPSPRFRGGAIPSDRDFFHASPHSLLLPEVQGQSFSHCERSLRTTP